jgi:hypothetical protein
VFKIEQTPVHPDPQNRRVLIRRHAEIQTRSGCPRSPPASGSRSTFFVHKGSRKCGALLLRDTLRHGVWHNRQANLRQVPLQLTIFKLSRDSSLRKAIKAKRIAV